jgi:hypothetical protein
LNRKAKKHEPFIQHLKGTRDKKFSANIEELKTKDYSFTGRSFEDMGHGGDACFHARQNLFIAGIKTC